MRPVLSHIARPDYAETGIAESERDAKRAGLIRQLSPDEIKGMRKACRVSYYTPHDMPHVLVLLVCLFVCFAAGA